MENPNLLVVNAAAHPVPAVHRAGIPLDDPYVEQCWASALGPTSILLLRRMPTWWREAPTVAVPLDELARSLGVGGTGKNSPLSHALDRIVRFKFAAWTGERELDVYTEVPPLSPRLLSRVPNGVQAIHEQLLSAHLDRLAASTSPSPPAVGGPSTASMATRLDHLERRHATPAPATGISL